MPDMLYMHIPIDATITLSLKDDRLFLSSNSEDTVMPDMDEGFQKEVAKTFCKEMEDGRFLEKESSDGSKLHTLLTKLKDCDQNKVVCRVRMFLSMEDDNLDHLHARPVILSIENQDEIMEKIDEVYGTPDVTVTPNAPVEETEETENPNIGEEISEDQER